MARRTTWIAVAVVIIVIVAGSLVYYWWTLQNPSPSPTPNVTVTLYAGEINATTYGFGLSSNTLTSPGPTLNFKAGDVVKVTVNNVGAMPHNWAIVNAKSSTAPVQFKAQIDSGSNPIPVGSSGSVTFTVGAAGSYFYICQVAGHVAFGMWGNVVVT